MLKFILFSVFFIKIFAQVSPDYIPFSISNPEVVLYHNTVDANQLKISFKKYAYCNKVSNHSIYRLAVQLDDYISGNISIEKWNIPDHAMLFIFNENYSYTGPYLPRNVKEFITGRFRSEKLIIEYIEPNDSEFIGDFVISNIYSDLSINNDIVPKNISSKIIFNNQRPKVMVTGYWPPTNEMVRHFSQDVNLNPSGWEGENWEGLGYDIVSFFPEFDPPDCTNCGQGYGNLEVDYQDFSDDFWPIIENVSPVAIITFSRGFNDLSWELENRLVNRTNWHEDYTAPFLPTPNPPDDTVNSYHVRYNSLPVNNIISAIFEAHLGLNAYLDNTNAGMYLSEFAGYHGVWYQNIYQNDLEIPCLAAGHIHVGGQIDWDTAKQAAEITIRTLIDYVNQYLIISGDANLDGEINVLDVVSLSNYILGNIDFTLDQELAADIDNNGLLNVLDIIAIVNMILS